MTVGVNATEDERRMPAPPENARAATGIPAPASSQGELSRDAAWRHARVATAAYYISQQRGFESGSATKDWELAEMQIDALDEAGMG